MSFPKHSSSFKAKKIRRYMMFKRALATGAFAFILMGTTTFASGEDTDLQAGENLTSQQSETLTEPSGTKTNEEDSSKVPIIDGDKNKALVEGDEPADFEYLTNVEESGLQNPINSEHPIDAEEPTKIDESIDKEIPTLISDPTEVKQPNIIKEPANDEMESPIIDVSDKEIFEIEEGIKSEDFKLVFEGKTVTYFSKETGAFILEDGEQVPEGTIVFVNDKEGKFEEYVVKYRDPLVTSPVGPPVNRQEMAVQEGFTLGMLVKDLTLIEGSSFAIYDSEGNPLDVGENYVLPEGHVIIISDKNGLTEYKIVYIETVGDPTEDPQSPLYNSVELVLESPKKVRDIYDNIGKLGTLEWLNDKGEVVFDIDPDSFIPDGFIVIYRYHNGEWAKYNFIHNYEEEPVTPPEQEPEEWYVRPDSIKFNDVLSWYPDNKIEVFDAEGKLIQLAGDAVIPEGFKILIYDEVFGNRVYTIYWLELIPTEGLPTFNEFEINESSFAKQILDKLFSEKGVQAIVVDDFGLPLNSYQPVKNGYVIIINDEKYVIDFSIFRPEEPKFPIEEENGVESGENVKKIEILSAVIKETILDIKQAKAIAEEINNDLTEEIDKLPANEKLSNEFVIDVLSKTSAVAEKFAEFNNFGESEDVIVNTLVKLDGKTDGEFVNEIILNFAKKNKGSVSGLIAKLEKKITEMIGKGTDVTNLQKLVESLKTVQMG